MFGLDGLAAKAMLKPIKAKIKAEGIKFIAVIPDESGDLDTRAFKEPCKIVPESFLKLLKESGSNNGAFTLIPVKTLEDFFTQIEVLNSTQTATQM